VPVLLVLLTVFVLVLKYSRWAVLLVKDSPVSAHLLPQLVPTDACVQLFESKVIVASPGSPGSKPVNCFNLCPPPTRSQSTKLRVAMETAEEQSGAIIAGVAPAMDPPLQRKNGKNVKFMSEHSIKEEEEEHPGLSDSLRQASIASCASEWVEKVDKTMLGKR
jgi:hypothetical protein